MSIQHTLRSDSRKKFSGSPLKLPDLNASGAMANDITHHAYSPGWLQRDCFEGPLTPLSSEVDYDSPFHISPVTDIDVDQTVYSPRSWLQRICIEEPLTPLSSEGASFDSLFSSRSDVSTDQIPIRDAPPRPLAMSGQRPPALTREGAYETFDGPLTPLESDMEAEEAKGGVSRAVAGTSRAPPTITGGSDAAYIKPQASLFDAAHACGWFPDPPPVPEGEIVVSDFADLGKIVQFPPSAWQLGPDGRLVRNYDVTFESPSMPIAGPLPLTSVVKREMRALMKRREEVMRVLKEEGDIDMRGVSLGGDRGKADFDNSDKVTEDLKKPMLLGPEGTEIYDGVSDYPEEWASHQSSRLCYHPTEEIVME